MKNLVSINDLNLTQIEQIFDLARTFSLSGNTKHTEALKGKTVAMLFYESSTRTKASFIMAARRLGADVLDLDPNISSVNKGETLDDTAKTLVQLGVHAVVLRHSSSGAAFKLAQSLIGSNVSVINAGDGMNEHPTQALLDAFSMLQIHSDLKGKQILILGDSLHSRVAKSNLRLLSMLGLKIILLGPPTLASNHFERFIAGKNNGQQISVLHDSAELIDQKRPDFVMVLRLQSERQNMGLISSLEEYSRYYSLNENFFKLISSSGLKILHPGPVNRGVEISSSLVDNGNVSLIRMQVLNGLHTRMSVLYSLLRE